MQLDRPASLKASVKQFVQRHPCAWGLYWTIKQQLVRIALMRYFLYDIKHTYRAMHWAVGHAGRDTLSAELLFQYHRLEKGLVMPGPKRIHGLEPLATTMALVQRWEEACHDVSGPIFIGALATLRAYRARLNSYKLDPEGRIQPRLDAFLTKRAHVHPEPITPRALPEVAGEESARWFKSLAEARRSVREFRPEAVPEGILADSVCIAQLSPSACNRQPCRVYVVSDPDRKRELLAYQNGNRGFGYLAPHVAIIAVEEKCFFDASERHEPYIDGGLFAMSLILALRAHDVSTCCLNWCVPPHHDEAVHRLFDLPWSQRIVMLVAIGYASENCMVPLSPRRSTESIMRSL
jgi:nitroreductase